MTTNIITVDRYITVRAQAFAGECVRKHRVLVCADGQVKVWDEVAGHFTSCHSLTVSAIRRIRALTLRG